MGSTGPTDAAIELYLQTLAHEVGPQGVRVACLWTAGVVETLTTENVDENDATAIDATNAADANLTMDANATDANATDANAATETNAQ